ncbi:hypothetical protein LOTGIDRAFT_167020 [Lottia gigantea]|uniref:Uncharacterized protein n=1 Tax=Lottia gigantea TaxID=225164 RepID=V3ZQ93_LOTGI|nr:hypothetical protein LOTGIDRAFT_167020 [Lottia gigantea]ESO86502.1 hypothetical protein LOTGIDRAFT_167020 [Lottia gigantea]
MKTMNGEIAAVDSIQNFSRRKHSADHRHDENKYKPRDSDSSDYSYEDTLFINTVDTNSNLFVGSLNSDDKWHVDVNLENTGPFRIQDFAKEWGIKCTTSSPRFLQSNDMSGRYVQTLKRMLKKADREGKDIHIALLEYRNSPVVGMFYSPAQLQMSRTLRTKLPTTNQLLEPKVVNPYNELHDRQHRQKHYFDRGSREAESLKAGDVVRIRNYKTWEPGVISRKSVYPRS